MKLSIITVNYNNRDGLQRTIDSVVCQTWRDFEWIIIDGGSTDGSKELIEQYQSHFAYWCSEPDKGIYNAMNKGIDKAKGEYLIFMNSGDCFYEKDTLQKVFELKVAADILSGHVVSSDSMRTFRSYRANIFMQLYVDTLNHQASFIKRTLFDKTSYDEHFRIVSDWKFWFEKIVIENVSFQYIDIIVAIQEAKGISYGNPDELQSERKIILKDFYSPLLIGEIERLKSLDGSRPIMRTKLLIDKGGVANYLTRLVLKILSALFL